MENPVKCEDVDHFLQMVGLPCFQNALERDAFEQNVSHDLELGLLGIGHPNSFKDNDKPTLSNVFRRVMMCIADYQKRLEDRDETNQRLSRELCDCRAFEIRLRDTLERTQREIKAITEKERWATERLRETEAAYLKEKNEVVRLTRKNTELTCHGTAAAARKELELEKKCDTMKNHIHETAKNNPPGIKIVNVLPRKDKSRGSWSTEATAQKRKDDLMEAAKMALVEKNAQLCNENVLLKRTLEAILQEIAKPTISKANKSTSQIGDGECQEKSFAQQVRVTLHSQQYFDGDIQKQILSIFRDKLEVVKESLQLPIHQYEFKSPVPQFNFEEKIRLEEELVTLKEELERREEVIQNHEKLLDAAVQVDSMDNPFLKDGFILEEKEKFQRERNFFLEQRSNFEKERRAFTEAAMRLTRDRKEFDEQRYNILKLHSVPLATPPRKPKVVLQAEHDLPSTPELYQVLGLSTVE